MIRETTAVLLLCAGVALAQEAKPEVAPFPLEIIRASADCSKKDREDLQKLLPMMLRAADVSVPDGAKLSAALVSLEGRDCSRDDACLTQLAKVAGSLYAFFALVDVDLDGNVLASGRVVRDDGKAAREPKTVKVPQGGASFRETAQVALKQLMAELDVARLSPFRPPDPVVKAIEAPVVVPRVAAGPVVEPVSPGPTLFAPALIAAGAGAACLVVGGALFATAGEARTDVSEGVVRVLADDASKVPGIQRAQTAGVALLGVGAGLGALGTLLFLVSPSQTTTAVLPINGGAAVLLTGELP